MIDENELSETLKYLRMYHRLSQRDLATLSGKSHHYLSLIETGKQSIKTMRVLDEYARAYKLSVPSILSIAHLKNKDLEEAKKILNAERKKILTVLEWIKNEDAYDKDE